jgi:phage tail sheath protein FI
VLREFWRSGALRGTNESDAYQVRCDRTTMTQDDLDNGRLVAEITVDVSVSIQRLDVTLTRNGSRITLERAA